MKLDLEHIIPRRLNYLHVLMLGLIIRCVYLVQAWSRNEILDFPIVDAEVYVRWAQSILSGNLLWHEPSNYTPMYPLYLAVWLFIFGKATAAIFAGFLLLGAAQAVVIGKTAELVWDRRTGLLAALLAGTYWPFVVIEATFHAENLALWTLSLGLLAVCAYDKHGKRRYLLLAGVSLAVASLCRANAILCMGALACWLVWDAFRRRRAAVHVAGRLFLFLAPLVAMSLPIMAWNCKLTGSPMLRTQGPECLYIGNEPDFGGLIVSPGWEWINLETMPLKDGKTLTLERERYWWGKTVDIVKSRPREWVALQCRKLLMLLGNYEVSQEIDIYRFRDSSPLLGYRCWPGFGFLLPLAAGGIILAIRRRESAAVPLWLCAAIYAASIFPFQIASRFRLLVVVPLLPFAAAFVVSVVRWAAARQFRPLLAAGAWLIAALAVVLPDHTKLAQRNVIDHWLYVGVARLKAGNVEGAMEAFSASSTQLSGRVDSLLQMGYAQLSAGNIEPARSSFQEALRRNDGCTEALLGLAGCAARSGNDNEAVELAGQVLDRWPNSLEALRLLQGIYFRQENWAMLEPVLNQMRTYINWPPDAGFQLARISLLGGRPDRALAVYDEIASAGHVGASSRNRALFLGGVLKWRLQSDPEGARGRWARVSGGGDEARIAPLAACLQGKLSAAGLSAAYPLESWDEAALYLTYTLAIEAWMSGDVSSAKGHLGRAVAMRQADKLKEHERSLLESWAVEDLRRISGDSKDGNATR
ncbi:MAG: tetratricopeptide repeat protein [bacterium]